MLTSCSMFGAGQVARGGFKRTFTPENSCLLRLYAVKNRGPPDGKMLKRVMGGEAAESCDNCLSLHISHWTHRRFETSISAALSKSAAPRGTSRTCPNTVM